jgi:hypothetical protein
MPERGYLAGGPVVSGEVLPAVPGGPAPGAVNTTPVVTVVGAEAGLVVGPDDVLVMTFKATQQKWELMELRRLLLEAGLREDQFVLVSAGWGVGMAKVARERPAIEAEADG